MWMAINPERNLFVTWATCPITKREDAMEQASIQETTYCDFNEPAVSILARKLGSDETDSRKITEAVFKHVRDNIRFGGDHPRVKASETLAKGYGACYNKALLMIALLRGNKIPARLAFNPVKREFLRPAIGEACQALSEPFNHCFVQVRLDGRWIAVDPTLDARTYRKFFAPHNLTWGIDWNGTEDMCLYTESITGPSDFFEDIDAAIKRDVGNALPPPSETETFMGPLNQQMWQAIGD